MEEMSKREFLKSSILAGIALGLGVSIFGQSSEASTPKKPKKLEKITDESCSKNHIRDGEWYIQYSVNKNSEYAINNKNELEEILKKSDVHSNVRQVSTPDGIKTLVGPYSSWQDAVQDSDKFFGVTKEVGIA